MHDLAHEFTDRKISPWGGIKYFYQTYMKTGLRNFLKHVDLPVPGSNRAHDMIEIIEGFMVSVVLGARRMEHSGLLRYDDVIREIFGWKKRMCSSTTFGRFFKKFNIERNDNIFPAVMRYWFDQVKIKKMTLDIDSTIIPRYGKQELAKKGYNPQKRGRVSHHPILAFCDELKMVVNAWMRSGDSHDVTDASRFLDEVFEIVERERVGLLRADRGFYSNQILSLLEQGDQPVPYIIRAKMTSRLISEVLQVEDWYASDDVVRSASYSEITYQAVKWDGPRRMIIVRIPKSSQQTKQKHIFRADEEITKYDYRAYVTNTEHAAEKVHQLYNQRGDCENRIKELKFDYAIDGFAMKSFSAMEAAFRFIMVAYNIMSLFRQKVMTSNVAHRLSTIKFQCIAIGSYIIKSGRNKKLKLSAEGKRRHFLDHFFSNLEVLSPPF